MNGPFSKIWIILGFLTLSINLSWTQIQVVDAVTAPYDATNLIENVFLGQGVELTGITHSGDDRAIGYFANGLANINVDRGIIMSTGFVTDAMVPNQTLFPSSGATSGLSVSDPQLESIATVDLEDQNVYEISFIPISDTLRFRYVFASEEYPEFVCSEFNDVFGFFINGPRPASQGGGVYNWENIAQVPDPLDPTGTTFLNIPVSINTVNNGIQPATNNAPDCDLSYDMYFNSVPNGGLPVYNGYLDIFIAEAIVIPCQEYTIKLAIGDGGDNIYDSAVFLEAKSFGTPSLDLTVETESLDGGVAEGCMPATLTFTLPTAISANLDLDFNILTAGLSLPIAENGVDYQLLDDDLQILAGQPTVSFDLVVLEDNMIEGEEYFIFDYQRNICNRDTVYIRIVENNLETPILPADTSLCVGQVLQLDAEFPPSFMLPDPPTYSNTQELLINLNNVEFYSDITVSGMVPEYLNEEVIRQICIDTLIHITPYDLDVYLITPGGQILELSTDNGWRGPEPDLLGLNFMQVDTFLNTCFTVDATRVINNGDPVKGNIFTDTETYTGSFLPEGIWDDLWDGNNPTNGTYRLLIIDDDPGFNTGVLKSWTISFSSVYDINFQWSSDQPTSLSCGNCEDPDISPEVSSTYYLTTTDSYGCEVIDSVFVEVLDTPGAVQNLICNETAIGELTFTWDAQSSASTYEISLDGGVTWIDVDTDLFYVIGGLSMLDDVDFWVRGINSLCVGEIETLLCGTGNCATPTVSTVTLSNVSCFGFNDGAVTVLASGTTGPYNYELNSTINQTGAFTGLEEGEYTILVTDDLDCSVEYTIMISESEELTGAFLELNPLECFGDSDGRLTITIDGGVGPFDFLWSDGQTDSIAINLAEDTYMVTVTDVQNCEQSFTTILAQPDEISLIAEEVNSVSCNGLLDGIGTVNIDGGVTPFDYLWENGTTLDSLFNVGAGIYEVIVTDANLCSEMVDVIIAEPDPVVVDLSFDDPSCFENENGMISVTPSGGTGSFIYSWSNGAETAIIDDLPSGPYSVTITDENLCTGVVSQELTDPDEINISFVLSQLDCFGDEDGSIDIQVSGGDDDFSFEWEGTDSGIAFQSEDISSLGADEYCITVTDGNMCTEVLCGTISSPDEIVATDDITDASCNGGDDGEIDLTIEGGDGPYVVAWTGAVSPNNEDLVDVPAGMYSVEITDSNNCSVTETYTVLEASSLIVIDTIVNVLCATDATGSISLTIEGGSEPYIVSWTGPMNFIGSGTLIDNLEAGTYNVTVSDFNACSFTQTYVVIEPANELSALVENDLICNGSITGMLSASVSGGTPPYEYLWSDGQVTDTISNIGVGNYSVTVTDDNDCSVETSANVIAFSSMEIFTSSTRTTCFDLNDGTASVDSVKVDGAQLDLSQLNFNWDTNPAQSGQQVFNLGGDQTFTVTVSDQNGCTATSTVFVERPDPLTIMLIDNGEPICHDGKEGFLEVMGEGGTAPYIYNWSINAGVQTDSFAQELRAGVYEVTVTDDNGCTAFDVYNIEEPDEIIRDYSNTEVSCFGLNDGIIDLSLSGGIAPYDLLWSTGDTSRVVEGLSADLYFVTIVDAGGCEIIDSVFIDQSLAPISFTFDVEDVSCFGGFDGSISIFPDGGNGLYQYSLDGENYNGSSILIGLEVGTYDVYVQDQNGCVSSQAGIVVNQNPELIINIGTFKEVAYGASIQLFPEVLNGIGDLTYSWTSASIDLFNCDNCSFPTISNITKDVFTTLTVIDENGCQATVSIRIITVLENFVDVPTGFTPDGDGVNDLLNVFGKDGILVKEFSVYDRWGEKLYTEFDFNTNDTSVGWDGSFRGQIMNPGVFVWTAEVENIDGSIHFFNGSTTLIR